MSRWFRHYAGMMRDEKLVRVAVKAKQPVERVVWVWGAILESAAEIDDGGRFEFDAAEAAYFLRADEADILAVVDALSSAGRISDNIVVKWGDRQFQSDKSIARQAAYRERRRTSRIRSDGQNGHSNNIEKSRDGAVTHGDGQVTTQETETEVETEVGKDTPPLPPDVSREAVLLWNDLASEIFLPKVQHLTEARRTKLKARLAECGGLVGWRDALAKIRGSPFLRGENDKGWKADFDFVLQQSSFVKIMEGKYGRSGAAKSQGFASEIADLMAQRRERELQGDPVSGG